MPKEPRTIDWFIQRHGEQEGKRRYARIHRPSERRVMLSDDPAADLAAGRAIKCRACGAIMTRLQWTHFKKCKVGSLEAYRQLYPDSPLVAPALCAKTSVTLDGLIAVYGDEDGRARWMAYCGKQAESNTLEYKRRRHGWDEERFSAYNAGRAVTLSNLTARHGDEEGLRIWERYCETQRYTNTLEYFMRREGDWKRGMDLWLAYNHAKGSSLRAADIAERMGVSRDEACAILATRMTPAFISGTEKSFIDSLEAALGWSISYTYKTRQFAIWSETAGQPFFYDACCTVRKKMIEFHGDYWHANPSRYPADFVVPHRKLTASDIWAFDHLKVAAAEARGFVLKVVWESEAKDPACISRIASWLNE